MLRINNISYLVPGRILLENANAHIPVGHKVGLVGKNGIGKTTLIKLITKEIEESAGEISIRRGCTVGTVSQQAPDGPLSPLETVLNADKERLKLLKQVQTIKDPGEIARLHIKLADIRAHEAPARAAVILAGLGFNNEEQSKEMDSFSGGWKMRVALACILFSRPDLLLLDEPTNHLDLEAVFWLESFLKTYPGTLLVVTHDRNFIDHVADSILHLDNKKLISYSGGYDAFEEARQMKLLQLVNERKTQLRERKKIEAFVDRFKAKATKARQAQSRVKILKRLKPVIVPPKERKVQFVFDEPAQCSSPLIKMENVSVGYDEKKSVLKNLNFSIFAGDSIALLGANGNGKTTLARLINGKLKESAGEVTRAKKLQIGYFAQDQLEQLNVSFTAFEELCVVLPSLQPEKVRAILGRFGFYQARADVKVKDLSGGEKTRLVLAIISVMNPNLLLLDEPANHLDVDARKALIQGLREFNGVIVLISHDQHLIEKTAASLWIVDSKTVKRFDGDLNDYRRMMLENKSLKAKRIPSGSQEDDVACRKEIRRKKAKTRNLLSPLKKKAARIETDLAEMQKEKKHILKKLCDSTIFTKDPKGAQKLSARIKELEKIIPEMEDEWLDAEDELEKLKKNN